MKKIGIVSIITALSIIAPNIYTGAFAKERNGFTLSPVSYDETGVIPDSSYELKGDIDEDAVITINDSIGTIIEKNGDTYTVTPDAPLTYNKLYTFTLQLDEPVSWTFQTAKRFCIERTLPGSNGYDVPVSSGIEITFSHSNYDIEKLSENVSISPTIDGAWEKHDKTAVFVPKSPLDNDTSYTVTISGEMANNDGMALENDSSFVFSTESSDTTEEKKHFGLYPSVTYTEFESGKPLRIPYSITTAEKQKLTIIHDIYEVPDEEALKSMFLNIGLDKIAENCENLVYHTENSIELNENTYFTSYALETDSNFKPGFYLVKAAAQHITCYSLVQITDTAAYIFKDGASCTVWLNNFKSGDPTVGAKIVSSTGASAVTDGNGIATFNLSNSEKNEYITVTDPKNGNVMGYYPISDRTAEMKVNYITMLETDRKLYKPDDTVNFWGVAKDPETLENLSSLTAELYGSYGMYGYVPLATADIECAEDSFSGSIELPDLDQGYYTLYIKNGEINISSVAFNVEDYQKPAYTITAESDKQAIFYGDQAEFTLKTSFFDGTALPDLDISYNHGGSYFKTENSSGKTDEMGVLKVTLKPELSPGTNTDSLYGIYTYRFSANASLPEIGDIYVNKELRVFYNDIQLKANSEFKNGSSTVTIHSDKITLDRLNDNTAKDYYDYIDRPDSGRTINGTLYFNKYVKHENGTYYDYFLKRTVTKYRYTTEKEEIDSVTLTTDSNGDAVYSFTPEFSREDGYYTFEASAVDDMGRTFKRNHYINTSGSSGEFTILYSNDQYVTELNKEKYDIGDDVILKVTKSFEEVKNPILFIKDFNGIRDIQISHNGEYRTTFTEIPGARISGVIFEPGIGYSSIVYKVLQYDTELSRLELNISSDKEKYEPGDECTLTVTADDKDGNPVSADININIVDEALLKLAESKSDVLGDIYSAYIVPTFVKVYSSHDNQQRRYGATSGGSGGSGYLSMDSTAAAPEASTNNKAESVYLRSDFKDTALYKTVRTNDDGTAQVSFKLPDNITSWRAIVGGVTSDLKAGNIEYPITVSMPSFLSYNMASTYIAGDKPQVGVTVYGAELDGSDDVKVTLSCTADESWYAEADGKPFTRINIPMPELNTEGEYKVTITAYINGTAIDALETPFEVIDTYNRTEQAVFYDSPYDTIRSGGSGNVDIIFTDRTKTSLASDILALRRYGGDRLDMVTSSYIAAQLWNEIFDTDDEIEKPDFASYQNYDGGMKLFTYSDSDPELTASLTPYIAEYVDQTMLAQYLNDNKDSSHALYALASLREPVLNELTEMAAAENLDVIDYLYTALALCELSETDTAAEIFEKHIEPLIENYEPSKRVRTGDDNDDINEATSIAALVSLYLGRDDADALYKYSIAHFDSDITTNIFKLSYIKAVLDNLPEETGSVKYSWLGEEHEVEFPYGGSHRITIPAKNADSFRVIEASDSVNMFSVSKEKMIVEETDNEDIKITRHYFSKDGTEEKTEFNENDIILVKLDIDFKATAANGGYRVDDYLPSGLAAIESSARGVTPTYSDGQKISYYGWYSGKTDGEYLHSEIKYYARVVNPGEFTADSAVLRHTGSNAILAATDKSVITIR